MKGHEAFVAVKDLHLALLQDGWRFAVRQLNCVSPISAPKLQRRATGGGFHVKYVCSSQH